MAAGKWIGGILGFMSGGALGALAGVALGALFDYGLKAVNKDGESRGNGFVDDGDAWAQAQRRQYYEGQRNSFLFSLLVLASYIIKADGKVMHSEMEFVRRFLRMNFGEAAVEQGNKILLKLFDEQKRMIRSLSNRLPGMPPPSMSSGQKNSVRMHVMYLFTIASGGMRPDDRGSRIFLKHLSMDCMSETLTT